MEIKELDVIFFPQSLSQFCHLSCKSKLSSPTSTRIKKYFNNNHDYYKSVWNIPSILNVLVAIDKPVQKTFMWKLNKPKKYELKQKYELVSTVLRTAVLEWRVGNADEV